MISKRQKVIIREVVGDVVGLAIAAILLMLIGTALAGVVGN